MYLREKLEKLAYRTVDAIESQGGRAQPLIGDLLTKVDSSPESSRLQGDHALNPDKVMEIQIDDRSIDLPASSIHLLHKLLLRNTIPVIVPLAGGVKPSLTPVLGDAAMYRICIALTKNPTFAETLSIERVIVIDRNGGLPSQGRRGGCHLYINLQQEYAEVARELSAKILSKDDGNDADISSTHLRNLVLVNMCLRLLGSTSSALITTPKIASSQGSQSSPQSLIHNLLTDKPLISPSLPWRRSTTPISETTLLRLGLPVVIYRSLDEAIDSSPKLEFSRLVRLIEDSFGRTLAIDAYRARIQDRIAAIIIAGDYEGAAIVTKESIPGSSSWIPYLDKFAVSSKSQGSKGVADIVFNILTSLFPQELVWRSRMTNPVNKWVSLSF
jgi:amino-acid N-acetyltransferase